MAKGVWNGGNASEAIDNARRVMSRDSDNYVGGTTLWVAIPAVMAMCLGSVNTAMFDEGGIDTVNDAFEIAGWTSVGAAVGYMIKFISRTSHNEGQRNTIGNIGSGVRD